MSHCTVAACDGAVTDVVSKGLSTFQIEMALNRNAGMKKSWWIAQSEYWLLRQDRLTRTTSKPDYGVFFIGFKKTL